MDCVGVNEFHGDHSNCVDEIVNTNMMVLVIRLLWMRVYRVFNTIGGRHLDSYAPMHASVRDTWLSHGGQPPGGNVGRGRWEQIYKPDQSGCVTEEHECQGAGVNTVCIRVSRGRAALPPWEARPDL